MARTNKDRSRCTIKQCRNESDIFYYDVPLCDVHWSKLCKLPVEDMKKKLGIKIKKK